MFMPALKRGHVGQEHTIWVKAGLFLVSAVLGWVQVITELDFSNPLCSKHNAEAHSVTIATVTLCDHSEQSYFLPLSSLPLPQ